MPVPSVSVASSLIAAVQRDLSVWVRRAASGVAWRRCHLVCHWLPDLTRAEIGLHGNRTEDGSAIWRCESSTPTTSATLLMVRLPSDATLAAIGHRSTDPVPLERRIGLDLQAGSQPSRSPGCWRWRRSAAQSIFRAAQVPVSPGTDIRTVHAASSLFKLGIGASGVTGSLPERDGLPVGPRSASPWHPSPSRVCASNGGSITHGH
jgi:hypothetical protein